MIIQVTKNIIMSKLSESSRPIINNQSIQNCSRILDDPLISNPDFCPEFLVLYSSIYGICDETGSEFKSKYSVRYISHPMFMEPTPFVLKIITVYDFLIF